MACLRLIGLAFNIGLLGGVVYSKWFTCVVFLIFLGGMIVVFLYISTLALNFKIAPPGFSGAFPPLVLLAALAATAAPNPAYPEALSSGLISLFHES